MTSIDNNPPASVPPEPPGPAAEPKPSAFDRIVGVLISPGETFESVARRPDWGVALAVIIGVSLIASILIATRIDYVSVAREAMQMNPRMADAPASAVETATKFTAATMRIGTYLSGPLTALALLLVAAVLQVSFRLFGGEATFQQAFSVTVYSWMPRLVKGLIAVIVLFTKGDIGFFDLQNPVMSNLAFIADPKANPLLYTIGSSLDAFSIWSVILLIIGFAVITKTTRGKSAAIVGGWWIVVNLFSLIGPAMQMLRK